jgi:hemolysin activation/secretion protein
MHASLELNDQYSQDTTHLRLAGSIRYDNLWQREHSLSLQFQTSPENTDEVKVLSANYLWRFDNTDTMLAFYAVKSDSNVATVGGVNIVGNGTIFGARVILPLPSLDNYFHSLSLGADYKHFGQSVVFGGTFQTPITYAPLSATYNGTEQDEGGQTQIISSLNFNLRGVISDEAEFAAKRVGASPNYFVFKADVQRTQKLPWDFQGFIRLDGQFAGQALISNEQYMAGGASSVRGYLESEVAGDRALHSTLELRTPPLLRSLSMLQDFRLLAFYDAARLRSVGDTGPSKLPFLASSGFGVRLKAFKNFNADLDFAVPLHKGAATEQGDFRSHVRLWYEF